MNGIRRKVFISYHHKDQDEVEEFVDNFGDVFITRALGLEMTQEIINSTDTDYVMRKIRELYLTDSTVTIVMIGKCTWSRRYVDWEIQASLRHGDIVTPNGLLGIVLPSANSNPIPPERLERNLGEDNYANWYWYPKLKSILAREIEEAFQNRTKRAHTIVNPRERFKYSKTCP